MVLDVYIVMMKWMVATMSQAHEPIDLSNITSKYVFIFRDAGETYGLLPLFRKLGENATGIIIPHGTAPSDLSLEPHVFTLANFIGPSYVDNLNLSFRETKLSDTNVSTILSKFRSLDALVLGCVSAPQLQIALAAQIQNPKIRIMGFDDGTGLAEWDNNTSSDVNWGSNTALAQGLLTQLWVCCSMIARQASTSIFAARGIQKRLQRKFSPTLITITGSPALSTTWPSEVASALIENPRTLIDLRRQLLRGSNVHNHIMIHFFGGYDDPDSITHEYANSVKMLARATPTLISTLTKAGHNATLTFSPHPGRYNGSLETKIFEEEGAAGMLRVVTNISSALLAAVSNATISHFSTCGLQSLFLGTPHVFFSTQTAEVWNNVASASGLIRIAANDKALVSNVLSSGFKFDIHRLDMEGIPRNATARMLKELLAAKHAN